MRKWMLNLIEIPIFIVISLACLIAIGQSTIYKDRTVFGYKTYVIASDSMYPKLKVGDVILVKDIDYDDIKVNDIISYRGEVEEFRDKIITHEVIDIVDDNNIKYLRTKGIGNDSVDPNVYENQVCGKFIYKFILISFIDRVIKSDVGFIFVILIPGVILLILESINLVKETRRRKMERMVRNQLRDIKRIDNLSKERIEIEKTISIQLDEIKNAKRDFKKMNELDWTVKISLEDIARKIECLKGNGKNTDNYLEDTDVLFNINDVKEAINKELKIKKKKNRKRNKTKK